MAEVDDLDRDPHDSGTDIQKVKTARGGLCYDLRSSRQDRERAVKTTVFRRVDKDPTGRDLGSSIAFRGIQSNHSSENNGRKGSVDHRLGSPKSTELPMPRLHRGNSEPIGSRAQESRFEYTETPDLSDQMITVDQRRSSHGSIEPHHPVDEPRISEDLHPSFSEGEYRKADRPRTRELNNFGVVSSRPGREKDCRDFSREATHFSDKLLKTLRCDVRIECVKKS